MVGRTSLENGRIWSRMTGVVERRNGRLARSAGPSALAPGRSLDSAGPIWRARPSTLVNVRSVRSSVSGSSCSDRRRLAS